MAYFLYMYHVYILHHPMHCYYISVIYSFVMLHTWVARADIWDDDDDDDGTDVIRLCDTFR